MSSKMRFDGIVILPRMILHALLHLYKHPMAQRHWSNLHGVLSRAELDAGKSAGVQSEAANPF